MTTSRSKVQPGFKPPDAVHEPGKQQEVAERIDGRPSVLGRLAQVAVAHPRRMLTTILVVFVGFLVVGVPGVAALLPGGYQDPGSESYRATQMLTQQLGQGDMDLYLLISGADMRSDAARDVGLRLVTEVQTQHDVVTVQSPWTTRGPGASALLSKDGQSALIVAGVAGGEVHAQENAARIAEQVVGARDGLTVAAGGPAMIYTQITSQTEIDLVTAEAIAIPLTFAVLVWVFGSFVAAALPLAVGAFAIAGTLFILRVCSALTDVSIFALNLTTALGFALAIDYTLLLITRYREERAAGLPKDAALVRTMSTAGRTVIFSAITVGLSMVPLAFFPMFFLRSFAYAGVSVVFFAAVAAIVVAPSLIVAFGIRIERADFRRAVRGLLRRPNRVELPLEHTFWYRWAHLMMRRRVFVICGVVVVLGLLALPFAQVKLAFPDDRSLASSLSARQVGDQLRADFPGVRENNLTVVLSEAQPTPADRLDAYAAALSELDDVESVSSPAGSFVGGRPVGPSTAFTAAANRTVALTVVARADMDGGAADRLLDAVHAVQPPLGTETHITGLPQIDRDSVGAIQQRLPLVLGFIAISSVLLLILVTGSILLPIKALLLNVLSLSAAFGAVVWVFQDGHFGGLGTDTTGAIIFNIPMLLFCVAFGLSMDYEVFVVARMREYWLASDRTSQGNNEAVALGLAQTGRVVTAAALVMSIVFAALIASKTAFMSMLGFGLAVAVLVDSTLVRATLVPALMSVAGRFNWWAPMSWRRALDRLVLSD